MMGKTACICLLAAGIILSAGMRPPQSHAGGESRSAGTNQPDYGSAPLPGFPEPTTQNLSGPGLHQNEHTITIFFTGNELGALKPCGCSGGQLGGLDRRYAVLKTVPPENRLIIDTGSLVTDSTEQNLIKFSIIVQAFNILGYDVVNLTEQDIVIARQAGLLEGLGMLLNCITAAPTDNADLPQKITKRFPLNGLSTDLTVAVAKTNEQISRLDELLVAADACETPQVNILILNTSDVAVIDAVSSTHLVDCLIVPPRSDEPRVVGEPNGRPLMISEGRLGKYVGKIQVSLTSPFDKPRLFFSAIPITEEIKQYQPLVELYKGYQRLVKEAELLEKYPRYVLPDNLQYVGSKYCKLCHDYEYEKWMSSQPVIIQGGGAPAKNRHANAYETLEKIGSEYDPECVICHVIGMQYESGFISPTKTPELKDVGCENCHGPGSEHLRSLGAVETSGPISTCTDCHTSEQSADYAANEKQYFEKIIHWREPVSIVRVKEPNRTQ
jgi:hypothetical protein